MTKLAKKRKKLVRAVPKSVSRSAAGSRRAGRRPVGQQQTRGLDDFGFPWRDRVVPILFLVLITFSIYFQVIHHPFLDYDDADYVVDNIHIKAGIAWPTVRWALTSTEYGNWHPVTWLSHALDWQLFGRDPSGHHFTSLLLHAVNVLLLFVFLAGVTKSTARSLLVAVLFAIHPIGVESVAWVAERKNLLCTMFFLLALIAYARYALRPNVAHYLLVAGLFVLGLASKPMLVTLPFVLLLLDYWPLQRIKGLMEPAAAFRAPQFPAWKIALEKVPLLALSAADSVVTVVAQQKGSAIRSGVMFPLSLRLQNAIVSYAAYLWKAAWPTRLGVLYPYPYGGLPLLRVSLSALVLIAISVWLWHERKRPYLLMGWLWFLGMLVPVAGLVQVGEQGMADRYLYISLIGIFILVVWGIFNLAQKAGGWLRYSLVAAAGIVPIIFAFLCVRQVGFWRSNYDLWSHTAAVTENNSVAEDAVGSEILVDAMNRGLHYSDEAEVHFQNAVRMNSKDSEALMNIGAYLQVHGRIPEALEKYKLALQYVPDDSSLAHILCDMASAYEKTGDFLAARQNYQKALQIHSKAGNTAFMGFARTFTDEKIAAQSAKLAAHPTAEGYWELGQLQDAGAYTAEAQTSYQHALELDPQLQEARTALAHDSKIQR